MSKTAKAPTAKAVEYTTPRLEEMVDAPAGIEMIINGVSKTSFTPEDYRTLRERTWPQLLKLADKYGVSADRNRGYPNMVVITAGPKKGSVAVAIRNVTNLINHHGPAGIVGLLAGAAIGQGKPAVHFHPNGNAAVFDSVETLVQAADAVSRAFDKAQSRAGGKPHPRVKSSAAATRAR